MSQTTRVYIATAAAAKRLEQALRESTPDAEWRQVPHASFSLKAHGAVLTCYRSGKVVVQGSELDVFESRFLGELQAKAAKPEDPKPADAELAMTTATVGSDETGKGDYFGPLVVAACYADLDQLDELREIGVTDSKKLDDKRARRLAGLIEASFDHEIVTLEPTEYNALHAKLGNLNPMLASMHAAAIAALVQRNPATEMIVVDKFAKNAVVDEALLEAGVSGLTVIQSPRAERHPVVAAASIIARAAFLDGLAACSDACGTDLHKGAGEPVDRVARRVFKIGGRELLGTVAKLHFRNTSKI